MKRCTAIAPTIVGDQRHGTEYRERGYEQRKCRADLDEACEIAEPLADADGVKQPHHLRCTEQFRTAGKQEHAGERDLDKPERDQSSATVADRHCLSE